MQPEGKNSSMINLNTTANIVNTTITELHQMTLIMIMKLLLIKTFNT